jgi:hypothetical protein
LPVGAGTRSDDGGVLVAVNEVDKLARFWEAQAPKLCQIDALIQGMRLRGDPSGSNMFKSSIVAYAQLLSNMDAACQEGCAIAAAIGQTLRTTVLVYRHLGGDALSAANRLRQQIDDLRRLP